MLAAVDAQGIHLLVDQPVVAVFHADHRADALVHQLFPVGEDRDRILLQGAPSFREQVNHKRVND